LEDVVTVRLPVPCPAPGPLEDYCGQFDDVFVSRAQRQTFRDYTMALLLPRDRNKTLTALAGAEPVVGVNHREVQRLQWFLSESPWDHERVNERRIQLLAADARTAPHAGGVLLLDDSGDRKWGHATAYVSRQYIGSRATVESGIVAVSTGWADERVYYPLHTVPYQPAPTLPGGTRDPDFRTKGRLATALVHKARQAGTAFRAVVADCFYGPSESPQFVDDLDAQDIGYVLALKPHTPVMECDGHARTPEQAVRAAAFASPSRPGRWHRLTRRYRDGHTETWWAAELALGPYGPNRSRRLIVASTDPKALPAHSTWYLVTNLPRRARAGPHPAAALAEIVRLYGLRGWIEQDYKQVKHELGWADFQVRSGRAIQRHWTLVNLAFTFCWLQPDQPDEPPVPPRAPQPGAEKAVPLFWARRLRQIRSYLTPLRDLGRLARADAVNLLAPGIAQLITALETGTGVNLYLPP
jgi:SRSO17 transposase